MNPAAKAYEAYLRTRDRKVEILTRYEPTEADDEREQRYSEREGVSREKP